MDNEELPGIGSEEGTFPLDSGTQLQQPLGPPGPRSRPAWRLAISSIWQERHRRLRYSLLVGCTIIFVVVFLWFACIHWQDPDRTFKLYHFLLSFFPILISVFIGFGPDFDKLEHIRWIWRAGVILCGVAYGWISWQSTTLDIMASRKDQKEMISAANSHTDQQIASVRKDLKEAAKHSDDQIATVRDGVHGLSESFAKNTSQLGESISKFRKPNEPLPAQLRFSLWSVDDSLRPPILSLAMERSKDDSFIIGFFIENSSATAAHSADAWLDICTGCEFAKEPNGLDRPLGMRDQTRHFMIMILNPHTFTDKKTIELKLTKPTDSFAIGFRYSCEVCDEGTSAEQISVITNLSALPQDRGIKYSPIPKKKESGGRF